MRQLSAILFLLVINYAYSQDRGVHFEKVPSWSAVLLKAKAEHKSIFVDCYATWCGFCMKMDKEVYVDSTLGDYFNARYISVKIQMDSTGKDNELVKSWYSTVRDFKAKYNFGGLPAYMFFSEDGKLLHRAGGFKRVIDLTKMAEEAQDPTRQYCKRIKLYQAGQMKFSDLPELSRQANVIGDKDIANEIGFYYKEHYLDTILEKELLSKKNVEFLLSNSDLVNSGDRFFSYCYSHPELFDSLHRRGVRDLVNSIIVREEITDHLWRHDTILTLHPNWDGMYSSIVKKYGTQYADNLLPPNQRLFYYRTHNWTGYAQVVDDQILKFPPQNGDAKYMWDLNNYAWAMFVSCNEDTLLYKALSWSNKSIVGMGDSYPDIPNFYDTRANLLYKLKKNKKAIQDEEKAINLSRHFKSGLLDDYIANKIKMEKGIPTWE